jgi:hypothetical protein
MGAWFRDDWILGKFGREQFSSLVETLGTATIERLAVKFSGT